MLGILYSVFSASHASEKGSCRPSSCPLLAPHALEHRCRVCETLMEVEHGTCVSQCRKTFNLPFLPSGWVSTGKLLNRVPWYVRLLGHWNTVAQTVA